LARTLSHITAKLAGKSVALKIKACTHLFNNRKANTYGGCPKTTRNLFLKGNTMSNPQQGANEAPKPASPADPQQQTQNPGSPKPRNPASPQQQSQNPGSPKPADKQPSEQQK
jgi:hypothetical protein